MLWSCSPSDPFHLQLLPAEQPGEVLDTVHAEGFLHHLVQHSVPGTGCGDWNGPLQTAQGIREVKSCSEKLDFILSDPTEFLTDSGQGTKQELCRWLWFAWLCLAGLLSAGWDLKNEKKWRSRWQTEMPSPLTVSHSWLWRGVCQNRCQCCLVLFFKISVLFISML